MRGDEPAEECETLVAVAVCAMGGIGVDATIVLNRPTIRTLRGEIMTHSIHAAHVTPRLALAALFVLTSCDRQIAPTDPTVAPQIGRSASELDRPIYLVMFPYSTPDVTALTASLERQFGFSTRTHFEAVIKGFSAHMSPSIAAELERLPGVIAVTANVTGTPAYVPYTQQSAPGTWTALTRGPYHWTALSRTHTRILRGPYTRTSSTQASTIMPTSAVRPGADLASFSALTSLRVVRATTAAITAHRSRPPRAETRWALLNASLSTT